jgi:hypothetical protein
MHVTVRKVSRLERLAVRRLRLTARTHACGVAAPGSTAPLALSGLAVLLGEEGGPAGGLLPARYATSAAGSQPANPSKSGGPLFGLGYPSPKDAVILLILALLGGLLSIGLLFGNGPWPIHYEWRSRWSHRDPWNRRH